MARFDNRGNLRGSAGGGGEIGVRGANEFYRVSKALKKAGEGELRKQFHKAVGAAAKPLIPKVRESARAKGPKKNGLNKVLAKKPYRVQTRTGASTAGVRIVGTKVDPRINGQGRIQHPVFGRPGKKVVQYDPGVQGYFDEPLKQAGPDAQKEVIAAMTDFTNRIIRGEVG